ncbi:hypothetical protein ACOMHN_014281 [Nucella lapillus]
MSDSDSASEEEFSGSNTSDESFVPSGGEESDAESGNSAAEDSGTESEAEEAGAAPPGGLWLPIIGNDAGPRPPPFTAVPPFVDHVVAETNRYAGQWIDS